MMTKMFWERVCVVFLVCTFFTGHNWLPSTCAVGTLNLVLFGDIGTVLKHLQLGVLCILITINLFRKHHSIQKNVQKCQCLK